MSNFQAKHALPFIVKQACSLPVQDYGETSEFQKQFTILGSRPVLIAGLPPSLPDSDTGTLHSGNDLPMY